MDNITGNQDKTFGVELGNNFNNFSSSTPIITNKESSVTSNETWTLVDLCDPNIIGQKSIQDIQSETTDWLKRLRDSKRTVRRSSCDIQTTDVEITNTARRKSIPISKGNGPLLNNRLSTLSEINKNGLKPPKAQVRRHSTPELKTSASVLEHLRATYRRNTDGNINVDNKTLKKTALPDKWYTFRDKVVRENQQKRNSCDQQVELELLSISGSDDSADDSSRSVSPPSHHSPSPHSSTSSLTSPTSFPGRFNASVKDRISNANLKSDSLCSTLEENVDESNDSNVQCTIDNLKCKVPRLKALLNKRRHSLPVDIKGLTLNKIMDTHSPVGRGFDDHEPHRKHHVNFNENGPKIIPTGDELVTSKQSARRNSVSVATGLHQSGDMKGRRNSIISMDKEIVHHNHNTDTGENDTHPIIGRRNSVVFGTRINEHMHLPGRRNSVIAAIDHSAHPVNIPNSVTHNPRRRSSIGSLGADHVMGRSTPGESGKTGGRHSNERHQLKHNYPLQIQKLLHDAEKDMPTSTLLEIKRLKEKMKHDED